MTVRLVVCVLLFGMGSVLPSTAQVVVSDSQQVRPERLDDIRRRIQSIRQTGPGQTPRASSSRRSSPSRVRSQPARSGPDRRAQTDLDRLEAQLQRVLRELLADEPTPAASESAPVLVPMRPPPSPPDTVRAVPDTVRLAPDTVRVAADTVRLVRDSARVVRDTLRTTQTVERTRLDTEVFRALDINFTTGTSTLPARATRTLDVVGAMLERYPDLRIEVAGHTDAVGPDSVNQRLSQERAESVRAYLLEHVAVSPDRIEARGYGEARPLASNDTPAGRALNRRVEFRVLASGTLPSAQ